MKISRRRLLQITACAAVLPALSRFARAQAYPARPVRIVVGFAAGGPNDIMARLIGQWLSERLGQQFIIENRTGASGNIATDLVVKAAADGYTLLIVPVSSTVNATLFKNLSFNFLRDIAPVGLISRNFYVMEVYPSVPAKTGVELISYVKSHPDTLNMGSPGSGTGPHMAAELFRMKAGLDMVHVPFRGSGPMITALLGGQVQFAFDGMPSSIEHIRTGRLRALGISAAGRVSSLPDVPAISEFLPGYEASGFTGLGAPRNTPAEIIEKLNSEIGAAVADPVFRTRLADLGNTASALSPAEFGKLLADETDKWARVIQFAGIKPE
jgi:tripartite-type tricarboxylate transporter receptor subunit TctC